MRLRADEPEARNVLSVLLDGKPVPMVYEADDQEGWVTSWTPDLPDNPPSNGEELVEDDDTKYTGFILIRRRGEVEIKFRDDTTSLDN